MDATAKAEQADAGQTGQTETQAGIECLFQPGDVIEVRVPKAGKNGTISGTFDDFDKLAAAIDSLSGKYAGVYYTLNPCEPSLIARTDNTLESRASVTTTDAQILRRRWLLIDVDPVRAAGISSSDAEKALAFDKAKQIHKYLAAQGWPAPVSADSGNGYHLLYRLDLPNDKESAETIKAMLVHLAEKFDDDAVKVDKSVFNAARIVKAYGTLSCKGKSTGDRPHRYSRLRSIAGGKTTVTLAQLKTLAPTSASSATKPQTKQTQQSGLLLGGQPVAGSQSQYTYNNPPITPEQMEDFMAAYGIQHTEAATTDDGRTKWVLEPCPFNEEHANKDASIFLTDGKPGFKCFHNSCAENNWKTLRAKLEIEQDKKFHFFHINALEAVPAEAPTDDEMVLDWADSIEPEELEWLWPNVIPLGKLTLFVGHPGVGKGMATMDISARCSTGKNWPDCKNTHKPMQCLIVSSEDAASDTLVPRLMGADADLSKIAILRIIKTKDGGEKAFTLDKDLPTLRAKLEKYPNIKLVVIDPLLNHLGALKGNGEQDLRQALTPLGKMAEHFKVAIVIVTHFNKNIAADMIQRVGGAQANTGAVRVVWGFMEATEDDGSKTTAMLPIKSNLSAKKNGGREYEIAETIIDMKGKKVPVGHTVWGKATNADAGTALKSAVNTAEPTKFMLAKAWLMNYLKDGAPLSVTDITNVGKGLGFSYRSLQRASKELNVSYTHPVVPGPWYWRLGVCDATEIVDEHEAADAAAEIAAEEAA